MEVGRVLQYLAHLCFRVGNNVLLKTSKAHLLLKIILQTYVVILWNFFFLQDALISNFRASIHSHIYKKLI